MAQQSDKDDKQLMTSESANGLRIEDLSLGSGRQVSGDDERMTIHYVGTFTDGRVFDSSREIGRPFVFRAKQVIPGLAQGMKGMRIGGTRRLTIPPALGYGDRQAGKIPPGSTLIFEVELLGIE
jgi:FKBP-type peptidyl-prolyl cis-trans isomerase FkpA